MPTIAEAQQRHAELMAAGKLSPEPTPAELQPQNASIPPKPEGTGINGPSRGGFLPGQVFDGDVKAYGPLGGNGPMRSRVFPFLPPAGNNNVAAQNAVKAEVAASKSAVSTAVANLNNTPVATVQSGQLTQTTIGKIPPLPSPPSPRFIPIDQVVDGLVYNRFLAVHMYDGGILPAHVNGQLASIDIGTITQIATIGGTNATAGWQVRGAATIDIPAGLNSITFTLGGAALVASGSGSFDLGTSAGEGWGVAIYSGSAPATPSANSNGVLTQNSTVTVTSPTAGSMNISFYAYWIGGTHLGLLNNGAFFGIHTVLPCAASAIT